MVLADTPKPYLGSPIERAYLDLLHEIMETGEDQTDRTGTGTPGVRSAVISATAFRS